MALKKNNIFFLIFFVLGILFLFQQIIFLNKNKYIWINKYYEISYNKWLKNSKKILVGMTINNVIKIMGEPDEIIRNDLKNELVYFYNAPKKINFEQSSPNIFYINFMNGLVVSGGLGY